MLAVLFALFASACVALAQNCGPQYANQKCAASSQYGWCDIGSAYCDPATCLSEYSGPGSSCAGKGPTTLKISSSKKPTSTSKAYASTIPNIDVCGHASDAVSCPGVGVNGYFYRCCSAAGHCGPKNDIQDQSLYCGTGCQTTFGKCDSETAPAEPSIGAGIAQEGETCGPIVNKKCSSGLCCSGSNFCGIGTDFCGAANWCQTRWGHCS